MTEEAVKGSSCGNVQRFVSAKRYGVLPCKNMQNHKSKVLLAPGVIATIRAGLEEIETFCIAAWEGKYRNAGRTARFDCGIQDQSRGLTNTYWWLHLLLPWRGAK
jgi:hypothetical protein